MPCSCVPSALAISLLLHNNEQGYIFVRLYDWNMSCSAVVYASSLCIFGLSHTDACSLFLTDICNFLMSNNCHLDVLDLSWNVIGEKGAVTFATALPHNTSLSELNIASNSIGDSGGQRIIKSLKLHTKLAKFNVSQNDIADGSCFVVAQVRMNASILVCIMLFVRLSVQSFGAYSTYVANHPLFCYTSKICTSTL